VAYKKAEKMSPFKRCSKLLGELLRAKGVITVEQLSEVLDLQESFYKDKPLGEIALRLGYIKKEELEFFLSFQKGYPYLDITNYKIVPEIAKILPLDFCRENKVIALDKIGDFLIVAMSNPADYRIIKQMGEKTKLKVKIFLAWPYDLEKVLEKLSNG